MLTEFTRFFLPPFFFLRTTLITLYTDGACSNNQHADLREGSWCFVLPAESGARVFYQYVKGATNNQMELQALLAALVLLKGEKKSGELKLFTDSQYVIGALSGNKANKNKEQIADILDLVRTGPFFVTCEFVRGHTGDLYNELCDTYAQKAIKQRQSEIKEEFLPADYLKGIRL
jgi:ribonuclease HI